MTAHLAQTIEAAGMLFKGLEKRTTARGRDRPRQRGIMIGATKVSSKLLPRIKKMRNAFFGIK